MIGKQGRNKFKLRIYLRSIDKPDDTLEKIAAAFRAMGGRNPDPVTKSMIGATRTAVDVDRRRDPDLVDLHFNIIENSRFIGFKEATNQLDCDYEIIDVRTGTLLDYDLDTLNIYIVGKRKIEHSEMQLPIPCMKVKDSVLQFVFDGIGGLTIEDIKKFYLDNAT